MSTSHHLITSAYRYLLRSSQLAFGGDPVAFNAARQAIRENFKNNNYTSQDELDQQLAHAKEVGVILRQNVVQGVRQNPDENKFTLRIHSETELGDNDDIKKKSKSTLGAGGVQGGCCGGSSN